MPETESAAPEPRENPIEPEVNPKRRLLMKSASLTASGSGQQRQQTSELQFDKFFTHSTLSCWKIRFKNQVTTCSDFPSGAMLWIKEVEMVKSLDEFKSSRSTERIF